MLSIKNLLTLFSLTFLTTCYNVQLARTMIHMSSIVFDNLNNINAWNCSLCKEYRLESVRAFDVEHIQVRAFVGYYADENAIVVVFRGTSNRKNVFIDLNFALKGYPQCPSCLVHSGFLQAYHKAASLIRSQVRKLLQIHQGASIITTGHSLGAALTLLCGLDLHKFFNNVKSIYTFGQPRVGNLKFAQYVQKKIPKYYRVINQADIVPHIPPRLFGYSHAGHQIWYKQPKMQSFIECRSQQKGCINSIPLIKWQGKDHQISYYRKIGTNNIAKSQQNLRIEGNAVGSTLETQQEVGNIGQMARLADAVLKQTKKLVFLKINK